MMLQHLQTEVEDLIAIVVAVGSGDDAQMAITITRSLFGLHCCCLETESKRNWNFNPV